MIDDPNLIERSEKHHDQSFHRNESEISFLTLLIHLNSNFDGGATNFHIQNTIQFVNPKIGQGIVFPHGIHENSIEYSDAVCKKNSKYLLRTDVMFKKN